MWIEAESFADLGGWVVDQQFMDVMGSPFLLAHGLGRPVANAVTQVKLPAPGAWQVWVRTRDWVPGHGPGRFRVRVNGRALGPVFGAEGRGDWAWQDGGTVEVGGTRVELALEDLTGFEGRCDAVLLVQDAPAGWTPPEEVEALAAFRREALGLPETPPEAGEFDFVVAGGGYAGLCAALAAARLGLKVALVHDRPVLGGNASGEVRVTPIGQTQGGPYPRNADIIAELAQTPRGLGGSGGIRACPDDDYVLRLARAEPNLTLFLEQHVCEVEREGERIAAIRARHIRTSQELRFVAPLFADCTGDAQVGYLAGADWRMGREGRPETGEALAPRQGDARLLGASNFWLASYAEEPQSFPDCPWALRIDCMEAMEVSSPKWPPEFGEHAYAAGWNWETGFNRDQLRDGEAVRDHNFRALYGAWDFLKNRSEERARLANAELSWVGYILGRRESRRLVGDLMLTQQDMEAPRLHPDGCVIASWYFDLHFPHPLNSRYFPDEEFRSLAYDDPDFERYRGEIVGDYTEHPPYPIPYRCFYSRNVPNLFMAGRNISATHVAFASTRVMNTTAMMGTVVGRAAYLCHTLGVEPRALYTEHLAKLQALLTDPGEAS